jgi:hypothetical protein
LWLGLLVTSGTPYVDMVPAFVLAGIGMTLFFVPLASLALGSVTPALEGVASGTNSAFREVGGVLGIAVLGAVFSSSGGYASAQNFVGGLRPAILVGAVVVMLGAVVALLIPALRRSGTGAASEQAAAHASLTAGEQVEGLVTSSLGSAA